jgi:hypothetical protein
MCVVCAIVCVYVVSGIMEKTEETRRNTKKEGVGAHVRATE